MDFCWQSNFLHFNMLSTLVIAFLPGSKHLLISWLQSPSVVILEPKKIKDSHCFHCFTIICHEVIGQVAVILVFRMLSFKPASSLSSFTFIKRLFSSSLFSAIRVVSPAYLRLLIFLQQSWFQLVNYQNQCLLTSVKCLAIYNLEIKKSCPIYLPFKRPLCFKKWYWDGK